jgi:hypothetical protein
VHEAAGDLRIILTHGGSTARAAYIMNGQVSAASMRVMITNLATARVTFAHRCVRATLLQCASFNLGAAPPVDVFSQGADYAFSDDAAASLTAACAPVVPEGLYQAASATAAGSTSGDMSVLAGLPAAGLWTVTVEDLAPGGAALAFLQTVCMPGH